MLTISYRHSYVNENGSVPFIVPTGNSKVKVVPSPTLLFNRMFKNYYLTQILANPTQIYADTLIRRAV